MLLKYVYKKKVTIRIVWIIYSIIFPFISYNIIGELANYDVDSTHLVLSIMGYLCIFNLILLLVAIVYIVFCIRYKYYLDILITVIIQSTLTVYSLGLLLAVGLLIGGKN